jgi:hypothetical protein
MYGKIIKNKYATFVQGKLLQNTRKQQGGSAKSLRRYL